MLVDPIELYRYPFEWHRNDREIRRMVESGLYILTEDGFLRRGITTATTASAAIVAAITSLHEDVDSVKVLTPVGIEVEVHVNANNGFAMARKFSGDHAFDVTDGMIFEARTVSSEGVTFGKGIGVRKGRKAVSASAMRQIMENYLACCRSYDYRGGVVLEIPDGEAVAKRTANRRMGVVGGISLLGTTGFVEPWCRKLVETKLKIAMQYDKIAITTGRRAWKYAKEHFPDYQPFVFGVHIDEALKHPGEKIIVGYPGLLSIWAGGRDRVVEKAKRAGAMVEVIRR